MPGGPAAPLAPKPARNPLIDIYRGLLIICVVIGHTNCPGRLNWLIYSFHMPAWFVISGMLHRDRPWRDTIVAKFSNLMVPYYAANIAVWGLLVMLNFKGLNRIFLDSAQFYGFTPLVRVLRDMSISNGVLGASWFLPVLFGVTLVTNFLIRLTRKIGLRLPIVLIGSLLLCLRASHMAALPFYFDLVLFCQFYYMVGYFVVQEKLAPDRTKMMILAACAIAVLYFQFAVYNEFFNVISRRYNNVHYFICFSLAGSYLLYFTSGLLVRFRFIREPLIFIGRNSIYILLFHFIGFKVMMLLAAALGRLNRSELPQFPVSNQLAWYLYVIFATAFSLTMAIVLQWTGGKIKKHLLGDQFTVKRFLNDLLFEKTSS